MTLTVSCRKLGFVVNSDRFTASPRFWSGDIRCNGNESNIEECLRGDWRRTSRGSCSNSAYSDVAVSCKTGTGLHEIDFFSVVSVTRAIQTGM